MRLTQEEIKAYLERIGIQEIEAPTKSYLFELHKAHVKNIAWQTVDIVAGRPAGIDFRESVQLITSGRGGYCFHLNGAFSTLLRSLGYKVSLHRAGVQPLGEAPRINSFHLGVTVALPGEQSGEEPWIVDVGLGDMPFEPMPLLHGTYKQGPLTYKVVESGVASGGWRMEHDPQGTFTGVDFDPAVVEGIEEFKPKHEFYSRSADSPWMKTFLLRQRHEDGSNELRGRVWAKRGAGGVEKTELDSKQQWLEVLGDVFGERMVAYSDLERDALWKKVRELHEDWKRSKEESSGATASGAE
ncbi:arylamine N-acetyltransferase [Paenibacillus sp. P25]|nr:arylamine N-acetyltransferase [Paenibacillus sp. P25]